MAIKRRLRRWSGAIAVWAALAGTGQGADLDLSRVCDAYTPLTLIGVDTTAGSALFSMPSQQPDVPAWIVELEAMAGLAKLYPDWREQRRFGGSVAPGPILVLGRCGSDCLQLSVWRDGAWREVGEPLTAASSATAYPTRDGEGVPWVILHRPTDEPGVVLAEAYRLVGGEWTEQGRLPVAAVGSPAARPAAGGGVVTGSGRFLAGLPAATWVSGLPGLPARDRGQLVPMTGDEMAYLARDGSLYISPDRGARWLPSDWRPERGGAGAGGRRWSVDLPVTDHTAPLAVAWFDDRGEELSELVLSERPAGGPWRLVARLPASERIGAEEVGYSHLLRLVNGRWLLLAGCEVTDRGCALRLRTVEPDGSALVLSVRLRPAWLGGG